MPLFNRFPYTNFHELNLNWILEQIPILKKYRDETEELHDDTKVLHDDTKTLHDDTKVIHDNVVEQHKEITAEITQGKKDISDLTNTGKSEITELTKNSKQDIVDTTTEGKNELNSIITTGTNQLDTLIDTGKADIKKLTDTGKSTIETATTTGKAEITNAVTDGKAQITTAKDGALDSIGTAKDSATTTIKNLESSATSAITAKGDLYLHQIADEGKKQTDAVTAEGTTQITNITQLGDTYKTEMTTLKNEAQTSADNAKTSETKAQEYAEVAKTLKPMYWGGDKDNYDATTNLWDACLYFSDASLGKTRHANVVIQENDNYSPDSDYVWYAHLTLNTNTTSTDKVFIVAFNYDNGNIAFGRYVPQQNRIFWNNISSLELESAWNATTCEITDLKSTTYGTNNITIPVGLENSPDATKAFFAKVTAYELGVSSDLLAWSKDGDMYVGHVAVSGSVSTVTWHKTVNLDEIHAEITGDIAEVEKKAWTLNESTTPLLDDTNLTITDVFDQKLSSFYISGSSKYKVTTLNMFMNKSVTRSYAKIYVVYISNNDALWFCPQFNAHATISKNSPSILWYFSRTLNIAEWTYNIKNPTMKVGNDTLEFTNKCDYNPNSCEYKLNVSFQGVEATNKMYKIILDSELTFLRNTGDIPTYIVASDDTARTLIPAVITHSPNNILELWITISEADKATIVGKTCFLALSLW